MSTQKTSKVLFIHGFLGSGDDWKNTAEALGTHFSCLCPTLPGHGSHSEEPVAGEISLDATLHELIQLRKNHADKPCILVAYSMGGRIALHLATRYPTAFQKIVLVSTTAGLEDAVQRKVRRQSDAILAEKLSAMSPDDPAFTHFLRSWYQQPVFAHLAKQPALAEELVQRRSRNNPAALAQALQAFSTGLLPPLWTELVKLKQPALIVTGEDDIKYAGIAERLKASLPHATHKIIPDSGHMPHIENLKGFVEVLKGFLENRLEE